MQSGPDICAQNLDRPKARALGLGCIFGPDRGERMDTFLGAAVNAGVKGLLSANAQPPEDACASSSGLWVPSADLASTAKLSGATCCAIRQCGLSMCICLRALTGKVCCSLWTLSGSPAAAYRRQTGSAFARTCRSGSIG